MILWAILCLSFDFSSALRTPSGIPGPNSISSSPLTHSDVFGNRSIWNIIWSCFSTLFACTWTAVHPNIPAPKASQWAVLGRRLNIMAYVFIAPEMVILWAARQHFGAKSFAKKHRSRGWTRTHAFFLIMGGFTLHDERGTPLRILEPIELETLSEAGRIEWPSITEAEIQDRSKGDELSKGIVLIQTSWFIFQCIVRGAYKLEVTELEVTTLAFAALTGVIYYLWWNKPLDVRCSVRVDLLKDEKEKANLQSTPAVSRVANPVEVSPHISSELNPNRINSQSPPIRDETQTPQQTPIVISDLESNSQEPSQSYHDNSTAAPEFQSTRMEQFFSFIRQQCQMHGTVLGLAYAFFLYPVFSFLGGFADMLISHSLDDSMPLQVPTFYSPTFTDYSNPEERGSMAVAMFVAVVFGGIHCVAWAFRFPTLQEKLAWRISAASVTVVPIVIFLIVLVVPILVPSQNWQHLVVAAFALMTYALFPLYVIARIALVVLPLIALRALDPPALDDIQWITFLPHIA